MDSSKSILLIGGDERQRILYDILSKNGYSPFHINCSEYSGKENMVEDFSAIVFPIPVSKDKTRVFTDNKDFVFSHKKTFEFIKNESVIFGGGFSFDEKLYFENEGIICHDILQNEPFNVQNAWFTAQGALRLLLDNEKSYIKGKKALITGFGKIGLALSAFLYKMGLDVTACARNDVQLISAYNMGFKTMKFGELKEAVNKFDYIFNTVPFNVFADDDVKNFKEESIYFELASAPFGTKKEYFEKTKNTYIFGGSLPGRFLAYSSAELIYEYIVQHI